MYRSLFALSALVALSCAEDSPTQTDPLAEAALIGDTVNINGAVYRLAAGKAQATTGQDVIITMRINPSSDGSFTLSDTVLIDGVYYSSTCLGASEETCTDLLVNAALNRAHDQISRAEDLEAQAQALGCADDVGNTIETAMELTVLPPTSRVAEEGAFSVSETYQLSGGDVDYFRLRIPVFCDLMVLSGPADNTTDTVGRLITRSGRVIDENDDNDLYPPNFVLWATGISPGTVYVEVRGATVTTTGYYSLIIGTWLPASGKPVASQKLELERLLALEKIGQ